MLQKNYKAVPLPELVIDVNCSAAIFFLYSLESVYGKIFGVLSTERKFLIKYTLQVHVELVLWYNS